jgi:WD40 repeat protein
LNKLKKTIERSLSDHEAMITACTFTPDSCYLISGSTAGDMKLWDSKYGHAKCLFTLHEAHDLGVSGCDFSSQYQVNGKNNKFILLIIL